MEERATPAVIVVDSGLDDGIGVTLRNALITADTNGEADTIQFGAGITTVNLTAGEIAMTTDLFNLKIEGTGVTINAAPANRHFRFEVAGGNPTFELVGLTMANGVATANGGGSILFDNDPLIITNVTFLNNRATGFGGAIGSDSVGASTINITGSTFNGNLATAQGGAVHLGAGGQATIGTSNFNKNISTVSTGGALSTAGVTTMTVNSSTFTENLALSGGVVRFNSAAPSKLTMTDCLMTGNFVTSKGGAVYTVSSPAISLIRCTIANNTANGVGGAISVATGTNVITNSTISGNVSYSTVGGGGMYVTTGPTTINNTTIAFNHTIGDGGGIRKTSTTGALTLNSTIVSDNTRAGTGGIDIHNTTATLAIGGSKNLVGSTTGGNFTLAGTNQIGPSGLSKLGNFGGALPTHAILPGTLALNNGSNVSVPPLTVDQRGFTREEPLSSPDIGAYESSVPVAIAVLPNVPPAAAKYIATVTYIDPLGGINTGTIDVNDVRLTGKGFGMTAQVPNKATVTAGMNGDQSVTVEYEFDPPIGGWAISQNGVYTLSIQAGQVADTGGANVPAVAAGTFLSVSPRHLWSIS